MTRESGGRRATVRLPGGRGARLCPGARYGRALCRPACLSSRDPVRRPRPSSVVRARRLGPGAAEPQPAALQQV